MSDSNSILEKYKSEIADNLLKIKNDYKTNIVIPKTLHELSYYLYQLKKKKVKTDYIDNLVTVGVLQYKDKEIQEKIKKIEGRTPRALREKVIELKLNFNF